MEERLEGEESSSSSSSGGDTSQADRQYVWGLRYIDDLILRDRDTTGDGVLNERLYALQDPNWNVVAIADTAGTIQERYTYDAYGNCQVEMSDEGLMTDDIEECLRVVIQALRKCDVPASELIAWCRDMLKKDRVGFICEKELKALRYDLEASRSK